MTGPMWITTMKCPVCGSDIRISDTKMRVLHEPWKNSFTNVWIETTLLHVNPIFQEDCGELMLLIAKEQKDVIAKVIKRIAELPMAQEENRG